MAGVKGFALGGGFEIALLADIIIVGDNAQFCLPEVRVGLIPGNGGTQTLSRLIGKNRAKELIYYRLATMHNLRFMMRFMNDLRAAIRNGTFKDNLAQT